MQQKLVSTIQPTPTVKRTIQYPAASCCHLRRRQPPRTASPHSLLQAALPYLTWQRYSPVKSTFIYTCVCMSAAQTTTLHPAPFSRRCSLTSLRATTPAPFSPQSGTGVPPQFPAICPTHLHLVYPDQAHVTNGCCYGRPCPLTIAARTLRPIGRGPRQLFTLRSPRSLSSLLQCLSAPV